MCANGSRFSIAIIPDSQHMTATRSDVFHKMTKWIVDHRDELNLQMVLHVGDVVNSGRDDPEQYEFALQALNAIIDAGIPLSIAPGNHDYDDQLMISRQASFFNRYFGLSIYEGKPWFGGTYEQGLTESHYSTLNINGIKYLFVSLEYGPRDEVMNWLEQLLGEHADHQAIINTHTYMYMDGGRTRPGSTHNPKDYPGATGANDGEDMWQKWLKRQSNVIAVFNGHHIPYNISYRVDLSDHGRPVLQSFQNFQMTVCGNIRIATIDQAEQTIRLRVASPEENRFVETPGFDITVSLNPQDADPGIAFGQKKV